MTTAIGPVPGEVTPAEQHPELGGRKPKSSPRNRNAPSGVEAFKITNQTNMQRDFNADGNQTQASKYRLIWDAPIKPAPLKLVLLAMAHFSDADGTSIRPAIATVGRMCSLSPKQARRHIQALVELDVLILERGRASGGLNPTHYALNLKVLASPNTPTDGSEDKKGQPSHVGTSTLPSVTLNPPTGGSQPTLPTLPSNVGEGEVVPTTPPSADVWHSIEMPKWLDAAALNKAMAINPKRDPVALLETAIEYRAEGVSADAINAELASMGKRINAYKERLMVARTIAPLASKKRATGRARALLIDPIRDTRAPGRNYKTLGVKA
jgi:hypothetical protein